jgi:thiol-disulfide isomerase/thioredoxin
MLSERFGMLRSQLILFIFVLTSLAAVPSSSRAGKAPESIAVLDSLTGDSAISRGSVVYVDFWASWCVPCRKSFPWMMKLLDEYGDKGLQVIAINVDRDRDAARKFLDDTHASLDVVYDPAGKLAKLYDLQVMPTSFVYGRDGTLRLREDGFNPNETDSVERLIRTLLEEKAAK